MAGLTRAHLERMPKLEICALHGVGLETSDLPAIRARGVKLTTTPVLFDDVADLAIALALACCRKCTFGRPTRDRDFHRQNRRNSRRCQRITVSETANAFKMLGAK